MKFTIFDPANGRIHMPIDAPDIQAVIANTPAGMAITEGWFDPETHYIDVNGAGVERPLIPAPSAPDQNLVIRWASPPPGLAAKVYDLWTSPPALLVETPLAAPDCGLQFTYGAADFLVELTADFPWRSTTWEVKT